MRRAHAFVTVFVLFATARGANANVGGIFGFSGNPATSAGHNCTVCHNSGLTPQVTLAGPTQVPGDEVHSYTLTVSGGQQHACGLDVSATGGVLVPTELGTDLWNGEITHQLPRPVNAGGACVFSFDLHTPIASGVVTLYASGNSVNGDLATSGDAAASTSLVITVDGALPGELPPVADAGGPYSALAGQPIALDGSGSHDDDGAVVGYAWDFGDGASGSGVQPIHAYGLPGTYAVTLTVTDDDGRTDTDTSTARIFGQAGEIRAVRVLQDPRIRNRAVWATAPRGDDRLFVVANRDTSTGLAAIWILEDGALRPTPFLEHPVALFGSEDGMRGLAFPPDYATSGLFYVLYSQASDDATVISRLRTSADPNVADPESEEVLLVTHPSTSGHTGSHIEFGKDGYLYISTGDGGADAQNAQDGTTPLGKMLRIDVSGGLGSGYSIPTSNPFVGPSPPLDEIWSKGFRNPYRFSIDPLTGDRYIADVGAATKEEVDVEPADSFGGLNFGWPITEGTLCRTGSPACSDGSLVAPVYDYDHDVNGRCAVISGALYRGVIPDMSGRYFFADWCSNEIWSFLWDGGTGIVDLRDHTVELTPDVGAIATISAIARDGFGELVIVDAIDGELFRVISTEPDGDADLVPDSVDNCPATPNRDQADVDEDGTGDACDTACADGVDNDGDGFIDLGDAGCESSIDESERHTLLPCDDGVDNDGDGKTDYLEAGGGDPGCWSIIAHSEAPECQDGLDNDNATGIDFDGGDSLDISPRDGLVDVQFNPDTPLVGDADPDCLANPWKNRETPGYCGLGFEVVFLAPLLARLAKRRRGYAG